MSLLSPCVHRSEEPHRTIKDRPCDGSRIHPVYDCSLFNRECIQLTSRVRDVGGDRFLSCLTCQSRQDTQPEPERVFETVSSALPADFLTNGRSQSGAALEGSRSGTVFVAGGGPTIGDLDLSLLDQRGIVTAAMNQIGATHLRPDFFFCVDPPLKFSPMIWTDARIMKITRRIQMGCHLQRPTVRNEWELDPDITAQDCPNVWFFQESRGFDENTFFTQERPTWSGSFVLPTRDKPAETRSVMLPTIRILHYLGFSRIVFIGCDFFMREDQSYAFGSNKSAVGCRSNNTTYYVLNRWFSRLLPVARAHGLELINSTPGGDLEAFPRVEFSEMVERVLSEDFTPHRSIKGLYGPEE